MRRSPEALLFLLILFSYGYFHHGYSWNQIARVDPILSFVEPGTGDQHSFRIDHFVVLPSAGRNTGDWARNPNFDAHYYSNKAPGPSFLGAPIYLALYHLETALGFVPESHKWTRANVYLLSVLLTALPAAFAAMLFYRLLRNGQKLAPRAAVSLTLLLFFGTALFPYGTQLWGHVSTAAFIVIALYCATLERPLGAPLAGVAIGVAVWMEYSAAIALAGIALMLAGQGRWRELVLFALGGLPLFAAHAAYHAQAFGSWHTLATFHNNPVFLDPDSARGLFGAFQGDALFGLTLSAHHGLFVGMPFLLLALPGFALLGRGPGRSLRLLSAGCMLGFLAMNLSYAAWDGGAGLGPRYLIPSLPFYVLLMASLFHPNRAGADASKMWAIALGVFSIANMCVLAIQSPVLGKAALAAPSPLLNHYRGLLGGSLSRPDGMVLRLDGDWSMGEQVVSARNGYLEWNLIEESDPLVAHSFVRASREIRAQIHLAWRGRLRLSINQTPVLDAESEHEEMRRMVTTLRPGENRIDLTLFPAPSTERPRVYLLAFEPGGRPLLPRPTMETPVQSRAGFNLGELTGLPGVTSLLPWLIGAALLIVQLFRASRDPAATGQREASSSAQ